MLVSLEVAPKKVFVWALDWPGWCRSGRTEELAIEALLSYHPRYAPVAKEAGLRFPAKVSDVEVVEQLKGSATTEFGAPGAISEGDRAPMKAAEAKRTAALVGAAWTVFDRVVAGSPAELTKGPRGGGRDRDKMVDHVLSAEASYARKLGIKHKPPAVGDTDAIAALRDEILAVLGKPPGGTPAPDKGWPTRYLARRIAWHILDHAWEIEDRRT